MPQAPDARRWYCEWEVALLVLVVAALYFSRLTALPIRAEETRRAMVAREILWSGDWIVPRQQGEPFLSRPPLGSYPIALAALITGDTDLLATRVPTALATLATTILIYGYSRRFLSRTAALAAGLGYCTMGQVLQLGQLAETEATFTLLVAGSLLVWHWGYSAGWSKYATWIAAYLFVALGTLCKGPQAPVYFAGAVGLFLLLRRDWRALVHPAHFAGIATCAAVLAAWHVPFIQELGWPAVADVWAGDVGLRFVDQTWGTLLEHLALFPLEVAVCLLPSSLLLVAFLRPAFWKAIAPRLSWASFPLLALAVAFPTCWLVPGAKPRYFMPLYPCFAPLVGIVVEELLQGGAAAGIARLWKSYQRVLGVLAAVAAAVVIALALWPGLPWPNLQQTPAFAAFFALPCAALAWWFFQTRELNERSVRSTLLGSSAFAGLLYTGLILNISVAGTENAARDVAALKRQLPPETKLVSLGLVETMFTYHFAAPLEAQALPESSADVPRELEYFVINREHGRMPRLPFAWEEVAVISCDRWRRKEPQRVVVVGRRVIDGVAEGAQVSHVE